MGLVAEDMVDGFSCSSCGVYFKASHGYPVLCRDCYKDEKKTTGKKPELPQATEKEL